MKFDRQDFFNKTRDHLLAQNAVSRDKDGRCLYRGPNGLKCAIGFHIKDEFFDMMDNGSSVFAMKEDLEKSLGIEPLTDENLEFISGLQNIHDSYPVETWDLFLEKFAENNGLTP